MSLFRHQVVRNQKKHDKWFPVKQHKHKKHAKQVKRTQAQGLAIQNNASISRRGGRAGKNTKQSLGMCCFGV